MGILFDIPDDDEISMPVLLVESNLTLAEIAVLFCLTAMAETGRGLKRFERGDADFMTALKGLKQKGIATINLSGNNLSIHIEEDKIKAAESEVGE